LLFLLFVQDIGHAHGAYKPPPDSMSRTLLSLAGFQVIITGRFWVIAEGMAPREKSGTSCVHSLAVWWASIGQRLHLVHRKALETEKSQDRSSKV